MIRSAALLLVLPLILAGCISTVATVVTAPVKIVGKGVNYATSGQSRADRNYGRKMRKQEQREGEEHRAMIKRCHKYPTDPDCGTPVPLND